MAGDGRRLLMIFAHPDDEAFSSAGTAARLAREGGEAYLVCATRGEAGQNLAPGLATPETLGRVREEELREAARILGIREVTFLDYRDGSLAAADPTEVVGLLVRTVRRVRPQAVLTFGPDGVYGHPDHVAVSRLATAAFHAAGDPKAFPPPEFGAPFRPARLWYVAIPREEAGEMFRSMADGSEDMRRWMADLGWENLGTPAAQIDAAVDVREVAEAKLRALRAHRTQVGEDPLAELPPEAAERLLSVEHFRLAAGTPVPGRVGDLFAGLA
ncbi:MAG TPA: PIG-L deacetylase family protein [Dehalococcoidia bacterium]